MAAGRGKDAARFVTGERAEVYRCVCDGVVGASGDSSGGHLARKRGVVRKGGLEACRKRSRDGGCGMLAIEPAPLLCVQLLSVRRIGRRTRRGPWPGDNESRPYR